MKEVIVLDVDQVLLDYYSGFAEWYKENYEYSLLGYPKAWSMTEWLGLPHDEVLRLTEEFALTKEFGKLDATAGAVCAVEVMIDLGYDIVCVTSCGTDSITKTNRHTNLYNHFGNVFSEIIMLKGTESKKDTLLHLCEKYNVIGFVDDKYDNIADAKAAGIKNSIQIRVFKHKGRITWVKCLALLAGAGEPPCMEVLSMKTS